LKYNFHSSDFLTKKTKPR